jgi:hypothetical protein
MELQEFNSGLHLMQEHLEKAETSKKQRSWRK